jgi:hypothetical protein
VGIGIRASARVGVKNFDAGVEQAAPEEPQRHGDTEETQRKII